MGQKVHPTGFRLVVKRNWSSRWYADNNAQFAQMLGKVIIMRQCLEEIRKVASLGRFTLELTKSALITIYSARPGIVIGKSGKDIERIRNKIQQQMGVPVHINIEEIRKPEIDAQLIADSIAQQIGRRIMYRRAMKRAMQNAMRLGAKGIKIMSAGRLNGIEIARTEWYREGRVPLHTLRADIDYATSEAKTAYGIVGVKVWVNKGLSGANQGAPVAEEITEEKRPRRPRIVERRSRNEGGAENKPAGTGPRRAAGSRRTQAASESAVKTSEQAGA